jgi:hypothetical protein
MLIMAEDDRRTYGETIKQFISRKKLNRECAKLEKTTAESFDTISFTQEENKNIVECKLGCQEAKELFEAMQREMVARRVSGYGNPRLFGLRTLPEVFEDTPDSAATPLLNKIKGTRVSINERVKEEAIKEREEKRKKMYEDLIGEGDKHNGPRR